MQDIDIPFTGMNVHKSGRSGHSEVFDALTGEQFHQQGLRRNNAICRTTVIQNFRCELEHRKHGMVVASGAMMKLGSDRTANRGDAIG